MVFNLNSDSISIGLLDTNADVREGSIVIFSRRASNSLHLIQNILDMF